MTCLHELTCTTHCHWKQNSTLACYTQYKPSELCDCVKALHRLFSVGPGSNLPAIREKYSQHKVTEPRSPVSSVINTVSSTNTFLFLSFLSTNLWQRSTVQHWFPPNSSEMWHARLRRSPGVVPVAYWILALVAECPVAPALTVQVVGDAPCCFRGLEECRF